MPNWRHALSSTASSLSMAQNGLATRTRGSSDLVPSGLESRATADENIRISFHIGTMLLCKPGTGSDGVDGVDRAIGRVWWHRLVSRWPSPPSAEKYEMHISSASTPPTRMRLISWGCSAPVPPLRPSKPSPRVSTSDSTHRCPARLRHIL